MRIEELFSKQASDSSFIYLDKGYWRQIEKLLSRNEFFAEISELGIIAMIVHNYLGIPSSMRELSFEEVFEKAEL